MTETYAYDGADKLTAITGGPRPRTFGYDLAGRTTSIVESAGTTTLSYDYDGRVSSINYIGGGNDSFTYNGAGTRVSSAGTNGSKTFRRNGIGVTSPLMSDGTSQYTPGMSVRTGSTSKFQHSGIKNTTDQTDSSQTVTASKHYDAFGNLINASGTWSGIHGYAGSFGYQKDDNGLNLLGHRYYDSETGRFLSQDPMKDGKNWYSYCENSPIIACDPNGLQARELTTDEIKHFNNSLAKMNSWERSAIIALKMSHKIHADDGLQDYGLTKWGQITIRSELFYIGPGKRDYRNDFQEIKLASVLLHESNHFFEDFAYPFWFTKRGRERDAYDYQVPFIKRHLNQTNDPYLRILLENWLNLTIEEAKTYGWKDKKK